MNVMTVDEARMRCWRVENPTVSLPPGYELWENEDFLYLLYGEQVVATFYAAQVEPSEILRTAEAHCQVRG